MRNARMSERENGISAPVRADREAPQDANGERSTPQECRFAGRTRSRWARTSQAGCTPVSSTPAAFSSQARYKSVCCSCEAANRFPTRWALLFGVGRVVRRRPGPQISTRCRRSGSEPHALTVRYHWQRHIAGRDRAHFRSQQLQHRRGLSSTRVLQIRRRSPSPAPSSRLDREYAIRAGNNFQRRQSDSHGRSAVRQNRARSQARPRDSQNRRRGTVRERRTIPNHPNTDREIVQALVVSIRVGESAATARRSTAGSKCRAASTRNDGHAKCHRRLAPDGAQAQQGVRRPNLSFASR